LEHRPPAEEHIIITSSSRSCRSRTGGWYLMIDRQFMYVTYY
jgi:hypothetical protein